MGVIETETGRYTDRQLGNNSCYTRAGLPIICTCVCGCACVCVSVRACGRVPTCVERTCDAHTRAAGVLRALRMLSDPWCLLPLQLMLLMTMTVRCADDDVPASLRSCTTVRKAVSTSGPGNRYASEVREGVRGGGRARAHSPGPCGDKTAPRAKPEFGAPSDDVLKRFFLGANFPIIAFRKSTTTCRFPH